MYQAVDGSSMIYARGAHCKFRAVWFYGPSELWAVRNVERSGHSSMLQSQPFGVFQATLVHGVSWKEGR